MFLDFSVVGFGKQNVLEITYYPLRSTGPSTGDEKLAVDLDAVRET